MYLIAIAIVVIIIALYYGTRTVLPDGIFEGDIIRCPEAQSGKYWLVQNGKRRFFPDRATWIKYNPTMAPPKVFDCSIVTKIPEGADMPSVAK